MNRTIIQILGIDGLPEKIKQIYQQNYSKLLFIIKDIDQELEDHLTICIFENEKQFQSLKYSIHQLRRTQTSYFLIKIGSFELSDQEQQEFSECINLETFNLEFCGLEEENKPDPIQLQELQDFFFEEKKSCCILF